MSHHLMTCISGIGIKHISLGCSGWEGQIFENVPQDITDLVFIVQCGPDISKKMLKRVNVKVNFRMSLTTYSLCRPNVICFSSEFYLLCWNGIHTLLRMYSLCWNLSKGITSQATTSHGAVSE